MPGESMACLKRDSRVIVSREGEQAKGASTRDFRKIQADSDSLNVFLGKHLIQPRMETVSFS